MCSRTEHAAPAAQEYTAKKPSLTHGKRLRPEGQESNRSVKRPRLAEASSVVPPNQIGLNVGHLEAMRILQHNAHQHSSILDLSMLDPATVQSLPFSMARTFVGKVTSLSLQNGMQCLPLICNAMPELEALHAPGFNGNSLDLSSMHRLCNLTGSAGTALKELHLHLATAIDFRSGQKHRKIRVWRYQDGQAIQQHPLPSRTYFKIVPGRFEPDFSSINFKAPFAASNAMIACSHLSQYALEHLLSPDFDFFSTEGYLGLRAAVTLPQKILPIHEEHYKSIYSSSKHYHLIDDASFAN